MSIHFRHGLADDPVEATPNDDGSWDVIVSPGHKPVQYRADLFDLHYPAIPNKDEFLCWDRTKHDTILNLRDELKTHDLRLVTSDEDSDALPPNAWILMGDSAYRPNEMPVMVTGWANNDPQPVEFSPLVALVPKN